MNTTSTTTSTTSASASVTVAARAAQSEASVIALLRQSMPVAKISDATTWSAAAVRKLAAREGLLIDEHGVPHQPGASPTQKAITQADLRELLRLAAACPDPQVSKARAKVDHALSTLRASLIEAQQRKERRAVADQVISEARRDIARLTAQLDQAKARLAQATNLISPPGSGRARPPRTRRYQPGVDYDTARARAWAKAHGHGAALPKSGRWVPDEVIDAMRAATSTAEAGPENAS